MATSRWSSPILPPVTTIDLHGKLVEDAITEVTLFLERIRTYHHHAAASTGGGTTTTFNVQIITGSGSHSRHGPILRSAVQKLLEKRRMVWKLEHGGGSFQVDALSGDDLYDPGEATDSKVLIAKEKEFHQLASSRRGYVAGSYAAIAAQAGQSSVAQCTATSDSAPPLATLSTYIEFPLPAQVLNDDNDVQTATRLSVEESKLHQSQLKQNECDLQRALSASRLEYAARERCKFESKVKEEHVLQQSIIDEQRRKEQADFLLEEDLRLAMERSVGDINKSINAENDLIQRALAESLVLTEKEKAMYAIRVEEDDDLLEKAFAESLVIEEETRKLNLQEQEQIKSSGVDLCKEYAEDDLSNEEDVREIFEKIVHIS